MMSGFSGYLCDFMKKNDISIADLSRETNIDRTVLYRYVKGSRLPSDVKIVFRIADSLQMSVSEGRHLVEEYDKLSLGEDIVYSYRNISKLLQSLSRTNKEKSEQKCWQVVRELKMDAPVIELNTKEEIAACIMDLFQYINEGNQAIPKMYLIMQPVYKEIQKFLFYIFQQSDISVEQIVCLERNVNQSNINMQIFQGILPLCFEMSDYKIFYYYDSLSNHINKMSHMPNLVILGDYVIQFDYEMKHGFVVCDNAYVETMHKHYSKMRLNTQELIINSLEADWNYFGSSYNNVCLSAKLLEPASFLPFEREMIIKHMVDMARTKHISYRFVSDESNLPVDIQLYWQKSQKSFGINRITDNRIMQVAIEEPSVCQMFQLYLVYMEKKGRLYSGEKSLHFLEGMLV